MTRMIVALALVALAPAPAAAAAPRSVAVDVEPAGDWRADALATALRGDLVDDRLAAAAPGHAPELAVHLRLEGGVASYELVATWPGAPPPRAGAIVLGGLDRAGFSARLRDELHQLARATSDDRAQAPVTPPPIGTVVAAIGLVAVLVALSFALSFARPFARPFAIGARRRRRHGLAPSAPSERGEADARDQPVRERATREHARGAVRPALRHAVAWIAGVGALVVVVALAGSSTAWLGLGGLAWGTFLAVTLPIAFPPIAGLGRIEQGELARVLGAWLAAAGRRVLLVAAVYVPVAVVTWSLADLVAVPLVLLAVRLVIRCAIAVGAAELDARLVDATADRDAWQAATRAYVIGYVRRARLALDPELVAAVELLPGHGDRVAVYGGGLATSRIVIPRRMLELALAPAGRPHDYAAPRVSMLQWTEWNAGLIMPTEIDAVVASREEREPHVLTAEGETEREVLGEPPTLAGTIEPTDLDPHPAAYRPHDDPMWLDWDPGDEHDGTDAGDRDFLFGAIVHALGEIQRHGDRLATLALLAPRSLARRTEPWVARATALGDRHAALAGARHHLVQYLGWRLWHREDLLTARAFAPQLEGTSHRILAALAASPAGAPALRDRIVRLADPARPTRWRRFAVAGAVVACIGVAGAAIASAVRYHATYVEETGHGQD